MIYTHDMSVKIKRKGWSSFTEGKISLDSDDPQYNWDNGHMYFCSNDERFDGRRISNRLGYKYSYCIPINWLLMWTIIPLKERKRGAIICSKCKTEVLLL